MTAALIKSLIEPIIDPDFSEPLSRLGSVSKIEVENNSVKVFLEIVQPVHWIARRLDHHCTSAITATYPEAEVEVLVRELSPPEHAILPHVRNMIAVASGKGGVGKSTFAANFAASLAQQGATVGLLDADIYGPSQPTMYGLTGQAMRAEKQPDGSIKGYPNEQFGVKVASIGFVMERDQAAILRGPMLAGYFSTLVDRIEWGELDFLIFDLPPGTGDIQLTLTQRIPLSGAVVVTTPQEIALADVRRSIQMFRKVNVDVLGVVENMSYFIPPDMPEKKYYIFGEGGGSRIATEFDVPFLGQIPIDVRIREGADHGFPFVLDPDHGAQATAIQQIASNVVSELRRNNRMKQKKTIDIQL